MKKDEKYALKNINEKKKQKPIERFKEIKNINYNYKKNSQFSN